LSLAASSCFTTPNASADTSWAEKTYRQAEKLADAGHYDQALALYEQIIAREPGAKLSYCSAGTAAAGTGQLDKAIGYYKTCEKLFPRSLTPKAELVKLYQITGDQADRDRERTALLNLYKSGKQAETKSVDHYIRDIFPVGARDVVAWEYFNFTGSWPMRYRFFVIDDANKTLFAIALSSSDAVNAKATTLLGRPAKARLFHLDLEQADTITTLKIFEGEPGYDSVKPFVIGAIVAQEKAQTTP